MINGDEIEECERYLYLNVLKIKNELNRYSNVSSDRRLCVIRL
jgi:hypothetical protein